MTQRSTSKNLGALAVALCTLMVPFFASAETVLRVAESVTVAADQTVAEDFYAVGGTVAVSGIIAGDMYAIGGSVTTNGAIEEDLSVLGGTVSVHAPVADDVRVVGGEITIAETVGGDVFVLGGSLTVLSSATIEGDVFFYGGEATINGPVTGSVMGAAERFRIDAAVAGDVDVRSSRTLVLGDRAAVAGDVRYASFGELSRATNAVVEGEVVKSPIERETSESGFGAALTIFFVHVFALLCLYLLMRNKLAEIVRETLAQPSRSAILGLASVVVIPVVAFVLMVTVLGFLLGISALFLFMGLLFVSYIVSAAVVGALLSRFIVYRTEVTFVWILAGAVLLHVTLLIPYLGALIVLAATVVTLGTFAYRFYRMVR